MRLLERSPANGEVSSPAGLTPPRNLRVLHVVDVLRPGGLERMAIELANLTDPCSFDCTVCATRAGGTLVDILAPHVSYECLSRAGRWDMRAVRAFGRLIHAGSYQIVHSHGRGSMTFVAFCRAVLALRYCHVFHNHFGGFHPEVPAGPGFRLCARFGFDAYIGADRGLCEWARRQLHLEERRIFWVRNGVDLERFAQPSASDVRSEFGLPRESLVFVMLAHLRTEKDHPTLLRALARSRHRARARLLLVGRRVESMTDYARSCDAIIRDLGLQAVVIHVGERDDVPALLAGCDVGVLSSRFESGPLALLEYLAAGLPYIVTATGEVTGAAQDVRAGFTVPVGDVAALASAIDAIGDLSPEERASMGRRGRELAVRDFDQRVTAARVAEIYRSLVQAKQT